jgi:hypothetical protein
MNNVSKLVLTVLSVITALTVAKAAYIANFTIDSGSVSFLKNTLSTVHSLSNR